MTLKPICTNRNYTNKNEAPPGPIFNLLRSWLNFISTEVFEEKPVLTSGRYDMLARGADSYALQFDWSGYLRTRTRPHTSYSDLPNVRSPTLLVAVGFHAIEAADDDLLAGWLKRNKNNSILTNTLKVGCTAKVGDPPDPRHIPLKPGLRRKTIT